MVRLILWRFVQFLVVSLILATALFFAMRVSGDPIGLILGNEATNEQVEAVRHSMGLDRPLYRQYFGFIYGLFPHYSDGHWTVLDFGDSIQSRSPAMAIVMERVPATLLLGATAFTMVVVLSIPMAVIATVQRGKVLGERIDSEVLLRGQHEQEPRRFEWRGQLVGVDLLAATKSNDAVVELVIRHGDQQRRKQ